MGSLKADALCFQVVVIRGVYRGGQRDRLALGDGQPKSKHHFTAPWTGERENLPVKIARSNLASERHGDEADICRQLVAGFDDQNVTGHDVGGRGSRLGAIPDKHALLRKHILDRSL